MTPQQRLLTALNHKEPDRIPYDLDGTNQSGIHYIAYRNLLSYLGIRKDEITICDPIQQLAHVHEDVLEKLKVDTRIIYPKDPSNWKLNIEEDKEGKYFIDQYGIKWTMHKGGFYFDPTGHPLTEGSIEELNNHPFPDPSDKKRIEGLKEVARGFRERGFPVNMMSMSGGFFEAPFWLRGFENFYCDLAGNPRYACSLMDKLLEIEMGYWDLVLSELGDYIDIALTANDLGGQDGPVISPSMYRKYIKPRQKKLNSFIKNKKSSIYIFFHCCGSIYDLLPDLIETGIDIINPVQVSAAKMNTKRLKKEFGDALTFWGGIDTQEILPYGTPQEVKDEVKRRIDDLAPGGGFVLTSVHNIQADVPPENIMAMWETLQEYGKY
ncbi:uroporphyrinogen-III decarboxylase [Candidatus Aerophobetes bacterium]|uniref:Uroporphyrinogen-III decarboxylase n=1 Tax=Aerophobetes bacterium TaxID=2030807 RepID=A0A662DAX3_UNCAE|nr:MAG: uroporphyrinogen-III decarboxylase [Candidatus Aerophobetes bacterium]